MEIRRIATEDLVCGPTNYVDALGLMAGYDYLVGRPTILFGPKGTGKTLSAYAWAHAHNWLLLEFGCTEGTKDKHLYGSLGMEGDSVFFTLGALTTAIDVANEIAEGDEHAGVILLLNEINCFADGAPVGTPYGDAPVERVDVNDRVLSTDPTTGQTVAGHVSEVHSGYTDHLYTLRTEEGIIHGVTGRHGYWTLEGWRHVEAIKEGDCIGVPLRGVWEIPGDVPRIGVAHTDGPRGEPDERSSDRSEDGPEPRTATEDLRVQEEALEGPGVPEADGAPPLDSREESDERPRSACTGGSEGERRATEKLAGPGGRGATNCMVPVARRAQGAQPVREDVGREPEDTGSAGAAESDLQEDMGGPSTPGTRLPQAPGVPRAESRSEVGVHLSSEVRLDHVPDQPGEDRHRPGGGCGAPHTVHRGRDLLAVNSNRGTHESRLHRGPEGSTESSAGGRELLAPTGAEAVGDGEVREHRVGGPTHLGSGAGGHVIRVEEPAAFRWVRILGIWRTECRTKVRDLTVLPFHTYHAHGNLVHNSLSPQMQKGLNSFTDWQKQVSIPSIGRIFRVSKDAELWVIGTMNPSGMGGIYSLNEDLQSRFRQVWIGYPDATTGQEKFILRSLMPQADEKTVDALLSVAVETRKGDLAYALSTRDLAQALEDAEGTNGRTGMGLAKSLKLLSYHYDEGRDRDTFQARVNANVSIDLAAVNFLEPPTNLTIPLAKGVKRRSSL